MYKLNKILCFLGLHKWSHGKITYNYRSATGSSTYLCDRCRAVEKTDYFNVFTGEYYRSFILPIQDNKRYK